MMAQSICISALIVAADVDDENVRYEYKRTTNVTDQPAVDFVRTENAPIALLR